MIVDEFHELAGGQPVERREHTIVPFPRGELSQIDAFYWIG